MKVAIVAILAVAVCHVSAAPTLKAGLLTKLRNEGAADVMIVLKDEVAPVVAKVNSQPFLNSVDKTTNMVQELRRYTQKTQDPILRFLNKRKTVGVKSYWITNRIFVPRANLEILEELSQHFGNEIAEIREQFIATLDYKVESAPQPGPKALEWGVSNIQAPLVWEDNILGQGVVVGHIDSGVRATHEALVGAIRDSHAWLDPFTQSPIPIDTHGHGTHTMGTILGKDGTGVAPNATYISCRGCDTSACPEFSLLRCGEFITCPTNYDESDEDCSKKPDISSNSWGGTAESTWYNDIINAWRAANIIPVFSIGNTGPGCRTAGAPGDQPNVISVGATTNANTVASFSSHGPSRSGARIKPEVSAPGQNVRSAAHTGDNEYAVFSGTSMAAPHVSGTVALLLSKNPSLTFNEIDTALKENNIRPRMDQVICTGGGVNITYPWPNNSFGHGKIDAKLAVDAVSAGSR